MFQQFIQKALVLFFVGLTIFSFGASVEAQVCQPARDGLVSWYRAEGDASDAQNSNNGSLQNGTTFAPGRVGLSFKFDGADDFVEIPDSASLKPQNLTVEAWVKFDSLSSTVTGNAPPGFQYIVFKKNANQLLFEGYSLIKLPNNRLAYSNSSNSGVQTTVVDNTQTIEVGRYYHIVGTYDGTTARLYVNGRKVGEQIHNLPLDFSTRPVTIGGTNEANWDGKMSGLIDEVRIYSRPLTEPEISRNYTTGLSLIINCDAEMDQTASGDGTTDTDVSAWENEAGEFTVVRYGATTFPSGNSPGPANRGAFFFAGGRTTLSRASQVINLADLTARIDAGAQSYNLSAHLGGFSNQGDNARVTAAFLNSTNNIIGTAEIGPVTPADRGNVTGLLPRSTNGLIPAGTRSVEITILMTRADGTYNDGYADNISFSLTQAAEVPANLAAWHAGDGDTRDLTGANDGVFINDTSFIVGKVGQAFRFNGISSFVRINSDGIFRGQTEGTIETWVRPRGFPTGQYDNSVVWTESEETPTSTRLGIYYGVNGQIGVYSNFSTINAISSFAIPQNEWTHVAATYKSGETVKLYVNGALAATSSNTGGELSNAPSGFVGIGALVSGAGDNFLLNGDVDEAGVYTRALSPSEIQSIYNAGTAGKERRVTTNTGTNVSLALRDATATFTDVTTAGETWQTPLDFSILPALPHGFMHTGLAYDISTTAVFSGDVNLCFNLPALANANFSRLRVLHLENGVWVNRTTSVNSPQLCGRVSSLSPFVIAENLAPTAASVAVSGRVTTAAGGRGVFGAQIALTDQSGATRYAMTNQFGYYQFERVAAGATYILTAYSKNYVFEPRTRVLLVNEELTNVDFTAQPNQDVLYRGERSR